MNIGRTQKYSDSEARFIKEGMCFEIDFLGRTEVVTFWIYKVNLKNFPRIPSPDASPLSLI
jgi:hypothetical protein